MILVKSRTTNKYNKTGKVGGGLFFYNCCFLLIPEQLSRSISVDKKEEEERLKTKVGVSSL